MSNLFKSINSHMKNNRGHSTLGGLILILAFLMFIPVFTSITGLYTTWRNLNEVATATIGMAKKSGGFNDEVLNLYNSLLSEHNIDRSKLNTIFYPGEGMKINKREPMAIELRHQMCFKIIQMDKSVLEINFLLPVKQSSYSQRYFRPSEL